MIEICTTLQKSHHVLDSKIKSEAFLYISTHEKLEIILALEAFKSVWPALYWYPFNKAEIKIPYHINKSVQ